MDIVAAIGTLAREGVKVEVMMEKKTIQQLILWGAGAAVLAAVVIAVTTKLISK